MAEVPPGPAAVTGATGYTGRRLLARLAAAGVEVRALVRSTSARAGLPTSVQVVEADLTDAAATAVALRGARVVYHLAHVTLSDTVVDGLDPATARLVVVSSLRALSRVPCPSVAAVQAGEATARRSPVPWTILRPSMIFGPGDDRNLSRLAQRLRRRAWLPLPGARHLHQPVFVEDVIDAILACPERPAAVGGTYAIAGARAVTYAQLVRAVAAAAGVRARPLPIPDGVTRVSAAGVALLERLRVRLPLQSQQLRRLLEDKAVDIDPARRDLGWSPADVTTALARVHGGLAAPAAPAAPEAPEAPEAQACSR